MSPLANEVQSIVHAFDAGDSRRAAILDLANRIEYLEGERQRVIAFLRNCPLPGRAETGYLLAELIEKGAHL